MIFDSLNQRMTTTGAASGTTGHYHWCGLFRCSHMKDCFKFTEDELDDLVLEDHICSYVC